MMELSSSSSSITTPYHRPRIIIEESSSSLLLSSSSVTNRTASSAGVTKSSIDSSNNNMSTPSSFSSTTNTTTTITKPSISSDDDEDWSSTKDTISTNDSNNVTSGIDTITNGNTLLKVDVGKSQWTGGARYYRSNKNFVRTIIIGTIVLTVYLGIIGSIFTYTTLCWINYVHITYLRPQLQLLQYPEERLTTDMTYYERSCGDDIDFVNITQSIDVLTSDPHDLYLSPTATAEEAKEHQMRYGFSIVENVLSSSTIQTLRDHINYRNYNEESLYVIEQKHRYSVLLSTTEPAVAIALEEMSNHKQFSTVLQGILGPNPAMVELTAISSSAGAVDQFWHEDTNYMMSTTNYVNSFRPLYSVFIQLQDTTAAMGATQACPGSHYCSVGPLAYMCEQAGFSVVKNHTKPPDHLLNNTTTSSSAGVSNVPYWKAGDALIMYMDSAHRGAAHTDPNAPDRIMLILSFTSKPQNRNEIRQMTHGITWQSQWDMWGHTLEDLKTARTTMQYPWVALKSLGIIDYYNKGWGVDYISAHSQRIINSDNGYTDGEYTDFINKDGGFKWLPKFLHGYSPDDYYEYVYDTYNVCTRFAKYAVGLFTSTYIVFYTLFWPTSSYNSVVTIKNTSYIQRRIQLLVRAILHITVLVTIAVLCYWYGTNTVDQTGWASDIRTKRLFTSIVPYEVEYYVLDGRTTTTTGSFYHSIPNSGTDDSSSVIHPLKQRRTVLYRPSTLPTRYDVLVETKYGSKQINMFTNFIKFHPGNQRLELLLDTSSLQLDINQIPTSFQFDMIQHIVSNNILLEYQGRFLYQFPNGAWGRMSDNESIQYVIQRVLERSNPLQAYMKKELRSITTDQVKFGIYRTTSLTKHHIVPYLQSFDRIILPSTNLPTKGSNSQSTQSIISSPFLARSVKSLEKSSLRRSIRKQRNFVWPIRTEATEPYDDTWIQEGDYVETEHEGNWYAATVVYVTPQGNYVLKSSNGEQGSVDRYSIRRWKPLQLGERVAVRNTERTDEDGNEYYEATTVTGIVDTTTDTTTNGIIYYTGDKFIEEDSTVVPITFSFLDTVRLGSPKEKKLKPDRFASYMELLSNNDDEQYDEEEDDEEDDEEEGE